MEIELDAKEFATVMEGLDYVKSKIAFTKGVSYAEKTSRLGQIESLEQKLHAARARSENAWPAGD